MSVRKKREAYEERIRNIIEEIGKLAYSKPDELRKYITHKDWRVRNELVNYDLFLDRFVFDGCWFVRNNVAQHNYGLEELVFDESWRIRLTVARMGYGLDILSDDDDERVRKEAVAQIRARNSLHTGNFIVI